MTAKEAISEIKHGVYRNTDNFEIRISKECYKAIIAALENRTPQKPVIEKEQTMFGIICGKCPECEAKIYSTANHFCQMCGQALDWNNNK